MGKEIVRSGIGGVLLAAGASTRFEGDKQLAIFEGKTLLRRAAETLAGAGFAPLVIVLGARAARHRSELAGLPIEIVVNQYAELGMASSLKTGIEGLISLAGADELEAIVVMVCDQPRCTSQHLGALAAAWRQTRKKIVASRYANALGVPALFAAELFPELLSLRGQGGAARLIQRRSSECEAIPLVEGEIDIDTREDMEALKALKSMK